MDPEKVEIDFAAKNTIVGRTPQDVKKYGEDGTAYMGKVVMSSGENPVLGRKVLVDVAKPHVMLICGKRGGGKCLDGDTEIVLNDGSLKKIKELEFEARGVLSLNSSLKINQNPKTDFYKRTVNKMLEITLASGKKIKLTPEHPLLTVEDWKPAQELRIGSRIATPRVLNIFGNSFLRECEVKLMAYLLTEGHTKNRAVWFTNADTSIQADFKVAVTEFDPGLTTRKMDLYTLRVVRPGFSSEIEKSVRVRGQFAPGTIRAKRNSLRTWLIKQGTYDILAPSKTIPEIIFQLPKTKLSLFLNRLFSCDGSVYSDSKRWRISYATASPKMAEQIHHLLLRFGIISKIRSKMNHYVKGGKKFPSQELIIEAAHAETFIREIGFFGQKEKIQEEALNYFKTTLRNPNKDTIPIEIWKTYSPKSWAEIGRRMGYKHPKALRESQFYAPSRQKLLQIAQLDENKALEMLATSDIYWDTITGIQELQGSFEVYDITVPETHNFVANDIIVHNSYSMAVLMEEFSRLSDEMKQRVSVIAVDMVGIFWTLKVPNHTEAKPLQEWGLTPDSIPVRILVPKGKLDFYRQKDIPVDDAFTLRVSELDITEWMALFRYTWRDPEAILLGRILDELKEKLGSRFGMDEIIAGIARDNEADALTKQSLKNRLGMTKEWGLLEKEGSKIRDIAQPGKITIIDVSAYRQAIGMEGTKDIIVALLGKKLFEERMLFRKEEEIRLMKGLGRQSQMPIVWLMIDEAHMFMPKDEPNIALNVLLEWVRVGRQPGLSLVLATQRPNKLHPDAISQCDLFISHRMTSQEDILAVSQLRPSYMHGNFDKLYGEMPRGKGFALLLDDNAESVYTIKVRPRMTWDGGTTANAFTK